jgi:hypothetical protein
LARELLLSTSAAERRNKSAAEGGLLWIPL